MPVENDPVNNPQAANITEPSIIFRIGKLYRPDLSAEELYDVTRGRWIVGKRRELAHLAFSVYQNKIIEIYEIDKWFAAGTTPSTRLDPISRGRWEFIGEVAGEKYRNKYINRSVAHYFKPGARNPVFYIPK
jgi:hypothetical protein